MAVVATAFVADVNISSEGVILYLNIAVDGDRRENVIYGPFTPGTLIALQVSSIITMVKDYVENEMSTTVGVLDTIHLYYPSDAVA